MVVKLVDGYYHDPDAAMKAFAFYGLEMQLITPMLATCPFASILHKHIIEKAKKEIEKARKLNGKIVKALEKYKGSDIPLSKEIAELKGVLHAYMSLTGTLYPLPDEIGDLLAVALEIEKDFQDKVDAGETFSATVFMKDEKTGMPILSSHMVLGFMKAIESVLVNTKTKDEKKQQKAEDSKAITTKVAIGEIYSTDVKWGRPFMYPDRDIVRRPEGSHIIRINETADKEQIKAAMAELDSTAPYGGFGRLPIRPDAPLVPALLERPLLTTQMGVKKSCIALSQVLPVATQFSLALRLRRNSPINDPEKLIEIMIQGKNQGLGQWRGSGGFGAFNFKLRPMTDRDEIYANHPSLPREGTWM